MNRAKQPWTEAEIASFRIAWADTAWTHADMVQSFRRPRHEIMGMARKLCLGLRPRVRRARTWRRWEEDEQATFERMLADGATHWDIAHALGRSVKAITRRVQICMMTKGRPKPKPKPIPASHLAELARRGINVSHLRR